MARRAQTIDLAGVFADPPPSGHRERDPILDATLALMSAFGMRRWSMDDVAARAGVGRATLYRRFESRHELVQATLRREASRFFAAITVAVDGVDGLENKVIEGFYVGLTSARASVVPPLIADSLPLLVTEGRRALVERYERMVGLGSEAAGGPEGTGSEGARRTVAEGPNATGAGAGNAHEADVVAEALIRLGLSLLTIKDSVIDFDSYSSARADLARLIRPLLAPFTN